MALLFGFSDARLVKIQIPFINVADLLSSDGIQQMIDGNDSCLERSEIQWTLESL